MKPGIISSETAAPPITCLRSKTATFYPDRARYAAHVRPLCPPPSTITSYSFYPVYFLGFVTRLYFISTRLSIYSYVI